VDGGGIGGTQPEGARPGAAGRGRVADRGGTGGTRPESARPRTTGRGRDADRGTAGGTRPEDARPRAAGRGRVADRGGTGGTRPGGARPGAAGQGTAAQGDRDGGRPRSAREGGDRGRAPRPGSERPRDARQDRSAAGGGARPDRRPGPAPYGREPRLEVPEGVSADQLDPEARAELRALPGQLADAVARWLVAASQEPDADRAYEYALQARKLAARVGVVRETSGVAAYRAGRWAEALAELRTARRLTGRASYLPLMADAERALGRPDRALAIIHDPGARVLDRATQVELLIVESGIRRDQGRPAAGAAVLQVPELTDGRLRPWSARLFYAYADALLDDGRADEAREWFGRAAAVDTQEETDAAERYEDLDSVVIDDLAEPEPGNQDADGLAEPEPGNQDADDLAEPEPGDQDAGEQ
jgi:hypothetical protein